MTEQLKALIFILAMTTPLLWLARKALADRVVPAKDLDRRLIAWIGILMSAFLSRNYWVYIAVSGSLLFWAASKDKNPMAVYLGLFFVVPPTSAYIPGFGGISYIIEINHLRLASAVILGMIYLRMRREKLVEPFGSYLLDWLALSYLVLQLALFLRSDPSVTTVLRTSTEVFLDGFLPYFVASRAARNLAALRDMLVSFVFAILLLAPITIFELGKSWLLYTSINEGLGLGWDVMPYIIRNGNVRPYATAGNSLVLGFILAVGVGLYPAIRAAVTSRVWFLSYGLLIAGLGACLARGSYLGAAAAVLVGAGVGRGAGGRLSKMALGLAAGIILISFTPLADKMVSYLPFVGNVDSDNVTYRTRLFDVSVQIIAMNPLFGSTTFMTNPLMEQMRQGQGIIDMVNSYLSVALALGYVGLTLYVSIFLVTLANAWLGVQRAKKSSIELEAVGRALLGTTIGMMIIIGTTSNYLAMPYVVWVIVGLSLRYYALTLQVAKSPAAQSRRARAPERRHPHAAGRA